MAMKIVNPNSTRRRHQQPREVALRRRDRNFGGSSALTGAYQAVSAVTLSVEPPWMARSTMVFAATSGGLFVK